MRPTKTQIVDLLNKAEKIKKRDAARPKRTRIAPAPGRGDVLASGGHSATYRMPICSQEHWDRIWKTDKEFKKLYGRTKEESIALEA